MKWSSITRLFSKPLIAPDPITTTGDAPKLAADVTAATLMDAYDHEVAKDPRQQWWIADPRTLASGSAILNASLDVQTDVALALLDSIVDGSHRPSEFRALGVYYGRQALVKALLRRRLPYSEADLQRLTRRFARSETASTLQNWLRPFVRGIELWLGNDQLSPAFRQDLRELRAASEPYSHWDDVKQAITRLDSLLGEPPDLSVAIDTSDDWGLLARTAYDQMPADLQSDWDRVLTHIVGARGTKPSRAWQQQAQILVASIGSDGGVSGRDIVRDWLDLLTRPAPQRQTGETVGNGRHSITGDRIPTTVISADNGDLLRGLVWCCASFDDGETASTLGNAAIACFKKISGVGPRSAKVGNACISVLVQMAGVHGVVRLQRLRQRVTQRSTITLIDASLDEAAQRSGLSRDDLDDIAVPDFDLIDGRRRQQFGDYYAEIIVAGTTEVTVAWFGPDGKPRKTEPTPVKQRFPNEVKALKRSADDLRTILPTQRDRIERLLLTERTWTLTDWQHRYLDHPLLSLVARRLIWRVETDGRPEIVAWRDGALVSVDGRIVSPSQTASIRLWHPIESDAATVDAWQNWLDDHQVTQPFKQAHREIYRLTDAERATGVYSNRFAGHILRQHQFLALARQRGWNYRLQGGFDGSNTPTLAIPGTDLQASFLVEAIVGDDDTLSDSGISLYISSDQVRFHWTGEWQPLPLPEIPPLVFSEVMRDVDLFVAVCSIGTDPEWADRGTNPRYRYWQRTAFSEDLSASAQTRKLVLARVIPRLKIASRCHLDGRFLVVQGDLRTYKIHLGSGNIMMEPNNHYLCIVPARNPAKNPTQGLFLPFEGDNLLSVILSKAFLLANDTAITDPTIVRQIR